MGICPAQVVSDGSALYPDVVKQVWPGVSHQLCLFHFTQKLTELAKMSIRDLKKRLPSRSNASHCHATQADVARSLELHRSGAAIRQIAKTLGVRRNSVKVWIKNPKLVSKRYGIAIAASDSFLRTIAENIRDKNYPLENQNTQGPPCGWTSWGQVDGVASALKKLAFQISSRKLLIDSDKLENFNTCIISPLGCHVKAIREFIDDWFEVFSSASEARNKWDPLKNKPLAEDCER